jgi:hypothetical protein
VLVKNTACERQGRIGPALSRHPPTTDCGAAGRL